jgi:hypothetical protein
MRRSRARSVTVVGAFARLFFKNFLIAAYSLASLQLLTFAWCVIV